MRVWMLVIGLALGCDDTTSEPEACALAEEYRGCPECSDGEITCAFETTSATEPSCGDCQARGALYQALCDDGSTASRDDIEAGTTCDDATLN